jgi:S-formylglutathione hydrolase FrmB
MRVETINSNYTKEELAFEMLTPRNVNRREVKKVLILLHGFQDKKEYWRERGKLLENYVYLLNRGQIGEMAFILPDSGYNGESWYTNFYKLKDFQYEEYFQQELIPFVREEFPSAKFGIVGFSMGGYGAFKLGMRNPDLFKVVGSISGAVSLIRLVLNRRAFKVFRYFYIPKFVFNKFKQQHFIRVFGSYGKNILKEDIYSKLKSKSLPKDKIKFYLSVGTDDDKPYFMVRQWIDIVGRLKKYGYNFRAYAYKSEIHTWGYVSKDLKNFLRFFNKYVELERDEKDN